MHTTNGKFERKNSQENHHMDPVEKGLLNDGRCKYCIVLPIYYTPHLTDEGVVSLSVLCVYCIPNGRHLIVITRSNCPKFIFCDPESSSPKSAKINFKFR